MPDEHIHIYERSHPLVKPASKTPPMNRWIWKCSDPTCPPQTFTGTVILGKQTRCPDCQRIYILDRDTMKLKIPKCMMCRKTKESKTAQKIEKGLTAIFEEIENNNGTEGMGI